MAVVANDCMCKVVIGTRGPDLDVIYYLQIVANCIGNSSILYKEDNRTKTQQCPALCWWCYP